MSNIKTDYYSEYTILQYLLRDRGISFREMTTETNDYCCYSFDLLSDEIYYLEECKEARLGATMYKFKDEMYYCLLTP